MYFEIYTLLDTLPKSGIFPRKSLQIGLKGIERDSQNFKIFKTFYANTFLN